jgi:hypothetical protein
MLKKIRKTLAHFIAPELNSMNLPNQFLRFGNKTLTPGWSQVTMNDQDMYTGYPYAAITKRARLVARVAIENVRTETTKDGFVHPYIEVLDSSPTFTETFFWNTISQYLDLEGVFYLMAIRADDGKKYSNVKEFKMLNPYNIRRVTSIDDNGVLTVGGYVEVRNGYTREIPPHMIIEIKDLNPFDWDKNYAMTDAAKESQFTLKTAGDFTRHALNGNINTPGIITTDVELEPEEFKNFTERVKGHGKGEPIFGNGSGMIKWQDMNTDLSKSSLKDINEINEKPLFAAAGVSKTFLGIEESGTTRETARVQKDMVTENEAVPRIQTILDSLNQDYRNNYPKEFIQNQKPMLWVDNPNATDHESDIKSVEVKQKTTDLYDSLLEKGYDQKLVAKYINGEIGVEELGEPDRPEPKEQPIVEDPKEDQKKKNEHHHNQLLEKSGAVQHQEGTLKNFVVNLDQQIVSTCINGVEKKISNEASFESQSDIISKRERAKFLNELEAYLFSFYGIILTLQGGMVMKKRTNFYALPGVFKLDRQISRYIKSISKNVAQSHVKTIIDDVLKTAREEAIKGSSRQEIVNKINDKYNKVITETRAKTIARTETNRAFTRAQFDADRQFIKQNKLEGRAFKIWHTRSDDPCPFCLSLEARGEVPFSDAFAELGDTLEVDGKKLPVNFETMQAGNAHPNCSCDYELVIRDEKV